VLTVLNLSDVLRTSHEDCNGGGGGNTAVGGGLAQSTENGPLHALNVVVDKSPRQQRDNIKPCSTPPEQTKAAATNARFNEKTNEAAKADLVPRVIAIPAMPVGEPANQVSFTFTVHAWPLESELRPLSDEHVLGRVASDVMVCGVLCCPLLCVAVKYLLCCAVL
jgi:hypothetical protein